MKKFVFIFFIILTVGCKQHDHDPNNHYSKEHSHKSHDVKDDKHGKANTHMHQSSVEELIERFESPERDAYQQPDKVLDYLGEIEGSTIMDIGAGSGYFSVKLAQEGANVIAADVEDKFLQYIENRIDERNLKNIETRKIPYDSPGLKEKEADLVFIVNTYHHIEDRIDYFKKVKNGTKDNGALVIIDFFKTELPVGPPTEHKISIDKIVDELKSAGYNNFEVIVDLLPYQYIIRAKI